MTLKTFFQKFDTFADALRAGQRVLLECRVLPTRGFEPMDLRLTVVGEAPPRTPPVAPPAVGEKQWIRMRRDFGSATIFDSVRVRVGQIVR